MTAPRIGSARPTLQFLNITSFTAGNDVQWTVPAGKVWRPLSAMVKLQTSNTVITRELRFWSNDNSTTEGFGGAISQVIPVYTQDASQTKAYYYALGLGYEKAWASTSPATSSNHSMSGEWMYPGNIVRTQVLFIQSGDAFTAAWLYVLEADLLARYGTGVIGP